MGRTMKHPSIVWVVLENVLVVIIAFSLFRVASTGFQSVVLAILIVIYAEVRRSRAHSAEVFMEDSTQYLHILKMVETAFHEQVKQTARLVKLKNQRMTNDVLDDEISLDTLRRRDEAEAELTASKEYRKAKICILVEQISLSIIFLLAYWKIIKGIIWLI